MTKQNKLSAYSKVYSLGHRAIRELLNGEIVVQEKIDGSQFSFGVINGELQCRSRSHPLDLDNPHKLFALAIETVKSKKDLLTPGWTYRAEAVTSPRHNVLQYSRIPTGGLIIYDIDVGGQNYLSYSEVVEECGRLQLERTPYFIPLHSDWVKEHVEKYLEEESCLGGTKLEGIVIKNYDRFTIDAKTMMGKYVSEAFKETMRGRGPKPGKKEAILGIIEHFKTEARWNKAIQHLRENGELENDPKDIGPLIKELHQDFNAECIEEFKNLLYIHFHKEVISGIVKGFPEFYKGLLMEKQFES
jgi:hypothetical protein